MKIKNLELIKMNLNNLVSYCKEINLDLIGLMCIPPLNIDPESYFEEMKKLNKNFGFTELSMGMSSDYLKAVENSSTYLELDLIFLVIDLKKFLFLNFF